MERRSETTKFEYGRRRKPVDEQRESHLGLLQRLDTLCYEMATLAHTIRDIQLPDELSSDLHESQERLHHWVLDAESELMTLKANAIVQLARLNAGEPPATAPRVHHPLTADGELEVAGAMLQSASYRLRQVEFQDAEQQEAVELLADAAYAIAGNPRQPEELIARLRNLLDAERSDNPEAAEA